MDFLEKENNFSQELVLELFYLQPKSSYLIVGAKHDLTVYNKDFWEK